MGGGVVERTLVCLWVVWMGIEGGGAVAVMDRWRISIFDLERNVVISHFQQERLWKMGGDDMEKALVRWCVDLVRIEGTGAADVLISWMDGDCAWRESRTCMADPWRRPCKFVSDRF
jgi:hypothetical protein